MSSLIAVAMLLSAPIWADSNTDAESELIAELVWASFDGESKTILYSALRADQWTQPKTIYKSDNGIATPTLATLEDGTTVMMWSEQQRRKSVIKWSKRSPLSKQWSEATVFSRLGQDNVAPSMVRDTAGDLWVFWSAQVAQYTDVYTSRQVAGNWSSPEQVNAANQVPDMKPIASLNEFGEVSVSWQSFDLDARASIKKSKVFAAPKAANGAGPLTLVDQVDLFNLPFSRFANGIQFASLHSAKNQLIQSIRIER